jgi:4-hydroxy-4-methyl-2-oxoglutarate aldolase
MFVVNEPPPQIASDMVALLRQAEPATIGHFRHVGFMDPGLRALLSGHRIAGTAVTVRCFGPDTTMVHYALGKLRPGDVLVIDRAGDTRHAACGGGVAFAARAAGCVGIIIDGMATDIDELREYGLRYGREASPRSPASDCSCRANSARRRPVAAFRWSRATRCWPTRTACW